MSSVVLIMALLIILVVVGMVVALMKSNEGARKQRALAVIKGQAVPDAGAGGRSEKDAQNRRRAEIAKKLKESGEQEEEDKKKNTIALMIEQAGMSISVKQFWIGSAIFSVVAMAVAKFLLGGSFFVVLMVGVTGFFGIPRLYIKRKMGKRQKKFLKEFGEALEAMVRLLKAGMPVTEAIKMAGREFEGPVGDEMSRIYDAQKVGITLPDAVRAAARRMPITEMQMFATAVTIQQQTGSSLSDVLLNLAGVIKARFRLKRKVQALSSEAKSSAMIIGALPFLIGGGLYAINPDYIGILFTSTTGHVLLIGAAVWMGMGILCMKMMINFKV